MAICSQHVFQSNELSFFEGIKGRNFSKQILKVRKQVGINLVIDLFPEPKLSGIARNFVLLNVDTIDLLIKRDYNCIFALGSSFEVALLTDSHKSQKARNIIIDDRNGYVQFFILAGVN